MSLLKIILFQELKINLKSKGKIIANILYFYVFLVIFQILTQNFNQKIGEDLLIISIILAILLGIICINNDLLERDNKDGTLEQIIIHCPQLEIYFVAKCLANWLTSSIAIILSASLIYQINGVSLINFWQILLVLTLNSLALSFLLSLFGSVAISGILAPTIFILAMPLTLPIMIITALAINDFYHNIGLLIALSALTISLSCLAGAKLIRISND